MSANMAGKGQLFYTSLTRIKDFDSLLVRFFYFYYYLYYFILYSINNLEEDHVSYLCAKS